MEAQPSNSAWKAALDSLPIIGAFITAVGGFLIAIHSFWPAQSTPAAAGPTPAPAHSESAVIKTQRSADCAQDGTSQLQKDGYKCRVFYSPYVSLSGRDIPIDACLHFSNQCGVPLWQSVCSAMGYESVGPAQMQDVSESYVLKDDVTCKVGPNQICASPKTLSCYKKI